MTAPVTSRRFGSIRQEAVTAAITVTFDPSGDALPCTWQDAHESVHVAAYCNLLSHLDSLADYLMHSQWCDELLVGAEFDDSESAELLFRYYTTAYLLIDQCFADCKSILNTASVGAKQLSSRSQDVVQFINRVWKHRGAHAKGTGAPAFHAFNHHGPYLFDDAAFVLPLPSDGLYMSVTHSPPKGRGAVPVVVPSLRSTIKLLGAELLTLASVLSDQTSRDRIIDKWGAVVLDD